MNQPSQSFRYGQLHSMSFTELFHLCVAIAGWKWSHSRERSLVVERATDCERRRLRHSAYAAVLLRESREVLRGDGREPTPACDETW